MTIYYLQKEKQSYTFPFEIKETEPNSRETHSIKNLLSYTRENKI